MAGTYVFGLQKHVYMWMRVFYHNRNTCFWYILAIRITHTRVFTVTRSLPFHTHVFSTPFFRVFLVLQGVFFTRHMYFGGHACAQKQTSLACGVFAGFYVLCSSAFLLLFTLQSTRELRPSATCYCLHAGLPKTRQDTTRQHNTTHEKTRPHKTIQDKTRQDKRRPDKTREAQIRQDKTRQDQARQDKTREDKTGQKKTRQDNGPSATSTLCLVPSFGLFVSF